MVFWRHLFLIVGISIFINSPTHALCINKASAVLRAGPGKEFKESWRVGKYMPFKKKSIRGGWVQVQDLDGEMHWVSASSVTEAYDCVAVKVDYTLLRESPSDSAPMAPARFADKYWPAKKVRFEDGWMLLEDDFGFRYWVKEDKIWQPLVYESISF